jgi:hypothetical protein
MDVKAAKCQLSNRATRGQRSDRAVQARPTPEKDSSSESENSAADGDTQGDDEYDEFRSSTARAAHVLVLGCNLSEKEVRFT